MRAANIGEAKAHFSALIKQAEQGERIVVTRDGEPVAQITSARLSHARIFGQDDGLGFIAEDFDAPLPPEILATFYK